MIVEKLDPADIDDDCDECEKPLGKGAIALEFGAGKVSAQLCRDCLMNLMSSIVKVAT